MVWSDGDKKRKASTSKGSTGPRPDRGRPPAPDLGKDELLGSWPVLPRRGPLDPDRAWEREVREHLAMIQRLEIDRRRLERERAEIDREVNRAYKNVARMLRGVAVAGGVMPGPSGAHRADVGNTKTAQVLAALPGTQAQVAERTGIKPTVVATLLGRLQRDGGIVRKVGTEAVPGAPKRRHIVYDIDLARASGHAGALWALEQRDAEGPR